ITTSALLDVLTGDELERLVVACAGAACPVLLTLSVVGRVDLVPADPLDARVGAAFNVHQLRQTRRGRLLGPDAVEASVEAFGRAGADVLVRPSPWRLGAACEQEPALAARTGGYARRRLEQARAGQLAVTVDHADLLILPRLQGAP